MFDDVQSVLAEAVGIREDEHQSGKVGLGVRDSEHGWRGLGCRACDGERE